VTARIVAKPAKATTPANTRQPGSGRSSSATPAAGVAACEPNMRGDVGHEERRGGGGEATVEPVHAVEAAEQPLDRRDACAEYQVRREGGVPAQPR